MMSQTPILYGVPFSQPVRAVMWLMIYKRMPFKMILINPGSSGDNGSRNPAYLGQEPWWHDSVYGRTGHRVRAE